MSVVLQVDKNGPFGWILRVGGLTFLWATMELAAQGIAHHYRAPQVVGMRYAVHLLVLSAWSLPNGFSRIARTRRPFAQLTRGACMFVAPVAFVAGTAGMSPTSAWAIFWISPLLVILLAALLLGERAPLGWVTAVGFCYLVGLWLLSPQPPVLSASSIGPIVAATAFAAYIVLSRSLRHEPLATSLFYTGCGAFVGMLPFMVAVWQPLHLADLPVVVGIGVAGLIFLLWLDQVLEVLTAAALAPFLYSVLLWEQLAVTAGSGAAPPPRVVVASAAMACALGVAAYRILSGKRVRWGGECHNPMIERDSKASNGKSEQYVNDGRGVEE